MRIETDMLGERSLSDDTLYGLQTLRSYENFGKACHCTRLTLIADALLESLELLTETVFLFRTKCILGIRANENRCKELLEHSATAIYHRSTSIGYDAAEKEYYQKSE
ncbi:MAG: hypothetical protein ACI4DL_05735 [Lachnospiraceae bacterium]